MKRMVAAAVILGTLVVMAQAQVNSKNAVGVIRSNCPTSKWAMVSVPFYEMEAGDLSVTNVFGDSLPPDTIVYRYNAVAQGWQSESYYTALGEETNKWHPGTMILKAGMGFFYKSGAGTTVSNVESKSYTWP